VIVRLMGEGQYRIDEDLRSRLNELDTKAAEKIDQEDEPALDQILDEMAQLVRDEGERLPDEDLSASDLIIPPSDLTLEETRALFSDEGLIPDLPVR
jgi:PspA-Associated protein